MTNMIKIANRTKIYYYIIYMMLADIGLGGFGGVKWYLAFALVVVMCTGQVFTPWSLGVYHALVTFSLGVSERLAGFGSINCIVTSPNFPL